MKSNVKERKYMMNRMLLVTTMLVSLSSPAFATLKPEINWLEPTAIEQTAPNSQKQNEEVLGGTETPKQGDKPFKEPATFNLETTRLQITFPAGWTWKSGEAATCCEDHEARASFNYWVEKPKKNDEKITQYGFQKYENDKKLKALLLREWEKRVRNDMAELEKNTTLKATGPVVDIAPIGAVRGLAAIWYLLNQQGISFRVTQFEIWEGGQRDIIQFVAMMEDKDGKDRNDEMIIKMAQSLKLSRTEANPVW